MPGGEPHKVDPRNSVDLLCSQEGLHPVPRLRRREGGAGHGRCPIEVDWGDPQDPPWVPAGPDDEEDQGGARALLPEDLPPVLGTPGPGEGGGQVRSGRAAGCVRGRCKGEKPGGLPGEYLAHDAVQGSRPGAVVQRVGRGRVGVSPAPSTNTVERRAADWGHAAYSSAYCVSGAPPWVSGPSRLELPPRARRGGGCGAAIPLAGLRLSVGSEGRGGRGGGRSPRAALR